MRWMGVLFLAVLTVVARADVPQPAPETFLPPGARPEAVDTVEALLAREAPPDGQWLLVAGYHAPGDGGGGAFRYVAASEAPADGGTVLAPPSGAGRYLRVYDPACDAYAEWFGAWGDGVHADQAAINACLRALGHVRLLARTYAVGATPEPWDAGVTYRAIELGPNYRIEGMGRDETLIRLLDGTNPHGAGPSENYFVLLYNRQFHESADNVVIRDLTIDCNFDSQDKWSTIHAIQVRGGNALVERASFRGYGTGRDPRNGSTRECFAVCQTLVYKAKDASRRAAVLRDLDFTDPGHNGDIEGNVAEITHIAIGGAHNFGNLSWILPEGADPAWDPANNGENEANWWPSYGGLVEGVRIHDIQYDPATQKSWLNGITYADCVGMVVRGNHVERFDGQAVFVMSWWNRGTLICDNQFEDVAFGVSLHVQGTDGTPNDCPLHEDVVCERNTIRIGTPQRLPYCPSGLHLYGESPGEGIRLGNMTFRGNTISGRAYANAEGGRVCPLAITWQVLHPNYEGIVFEDNVIDMPDYPDAGIAPKEPYGQSALYYPLARWEDDSRSGRFVFRNNRAPD